MPRQPTRIPLDLTIGERRVEEITVYDPSIGDKDDLDARTDLTDVTIYVRIKQLITDADGDAIWNAETGDGVTNRDQTGATIGKARIVFPKSLTLTLDEGRYVWDVWAEDALGPQPVIDPSPLRVTRGVYTPT
jgi:hypothetical protein